MSKQTLLPKWIAVLAVAVGIAGGSYGLASAATGGSSGSAAQSAPATTRAAPPAAAPSGQPWGGQRSDETPLTGDALARVTKAAQAKVSGGTVMRVETDADGHALYEAHMTDASGAPTTVYVDKGYAVVGVESR